MRTDPGHRRRRVGARAFLAADPGLAVPVECGDVADPGDVDTEADRQAMG